MGNLCCVIHCFFQRNLNKYIIIISWKTKRATDRLCEYSWAELESLPSLEWSLVYNWSCRVLAKPLWRHNKSRQFAKHHGPQSGWATRAEDDPEESFTQKQWEPKGGWGNKRWPSNPRNCLFFLLGSLSTKRRKRTTRELELSRLKRK